MTDSEFLYWVATRIVKVYGESENVDFVLKLKEIAMKIASRRSAVSRLVDILTEAELT